METITLKCQLCSKQFEVFLMLAQYDLPRICNECQSDMEAYRQ